MCHLIRMFIDPKNAPNVKIVATSIGKGRKLNPMLDFLEKKYAETIKGAGLYRTGCGIPLSRPGDGNGWVVKARGSLLFFSPPRKQHLCAQKGCDFNSLKF